MLQSILLITGLVWLLLTALLYLFQPHFIYYPHKQLLGTPEDIDLAYRDVALQTDDGLSIHGWYIPHPEARAKLLFLHGNAGNVSHRLDSLKIFNDLGLSVFIIDYRGYGRSDGRPSEQGTYKDAKAAWHYLNEQLNKDDQAIIVFGRSLGGGVASWLATQVNTDGLILESTFTSIMDMGKHYYPYLPIPLITRIRYDSLANITAITSPILFIHSQNDQIVPYKYGRALFAKATSEKIFVDITGDHNSGFIVSGKSYTDALDAFIQGIIEQ